MKIAYAFHRDARNPAVQSSRPSSILRHLERAGHEIVEAFPLPSRLPRGTFLKKVLHRLRGQYYRGDRERSYLEGIADQFDHKIAGQAYDLVFCPGSEAVSELRTRRPIVFCADATFANMVDYYWDFTNLPAGYKARGHAQELGALNRASLAIYPSQWAADSAMADYAAPKSKVAVIPFGANFGAENQRAEVLRWIGERPADRVRILFVGRHWERKGGALVVETARRLIARGLRVELHIVGCHAPEHDEWIVQHGSLNPGGAAEVAKLEALFREAHFVFVPSRAEAYGMTFCEANAFGVPAIGTRTGGIPEIIRPGVNGFLFDLDAEPEQCAAEIAAGFQNGYREMAERSFGEFESRLNWKTFCDELMARADTLVARASAHSGKKPVKIAYIANRFLDPSRARAWSGLPLFIRQALEQAGFDVVLVAGLRESHTVWRWTRFIWWRLARRRRFLRESDVPLLRSYARQAARHIAELRPDIVLAPGAWPIAYLETSVPIVFWTDATFASVLDYYEAFSNLAPPSICDGHAVERAALSRCALAIYSSEWAAASARSYGVTSPERVVVVPFGANLSHPPTRDAVEATIEARPAGRCRLLFMGVDWERKGGALALAVTALLRQRGVPAELTIAGCSPPRGTCLPAGTRCAGFLSKATEEGSRAVASLFSEADIFILPTRAEAYGLVFCEAAAFGLPVLATRTGGIPTIVEDGVTGVLLPMEAGAEAYAGKIEALLADRPGYTAMALRARAAYEQRLNWEAAGRRIAELLAQILASR